MYHQLQHSEILCSAHNTFMCFAWISEQTAICSLYRINFSVLITEAECVYCAVRTGSLNQIQFRLYRVKVPLPLYYRKRKFCVRFQNAVTLKLGNLKWRKSWSVCTRNQGVLRLINSNVKCCKDQIWHTFFHGLRPMSHAKWFYNINQ
jgi:hypothetical protein